ncbi:MAG: hypothetical protein WBZ14_07750, partial [Terriglobales bacterium]
RSASVCSFALFYFRSSLPPSSGQFAKTFFHPSEAPLEIRCLNRAQLKVQEGSEIGRDPRVHLACVYIRDQPSHRVPHSNHVVQRRQRVCVFATFVTLPSAPDAAQFRSFIGIGMEKA